MRISELAAQTGLAPSAIRYYEQRDMFSTGQITRHPNGYRDYSEDALRRVLLILAGRAAGFSLSQMRHQMSDWETLGNAERSRLLEDQLGVIDSRISELRRGRETIQAALQELRRRSGTGESLETPTGREG
ncbi:MerR family transcriptional regulator [Arthrobacter sp. NPDC090010]|uniref:MerR family transcriptional regulator n=1 Tax=Arthrobacter sp. NPDC090010 TaxID=3363942 RepID=UPI0037F32109